MDKHPSDEEWRQRLTPLQFAVCRLKETEPPFTGEYVDCEEKGIYCCVACGAQLFRSGEKYHSGSGWPSFWTPVSPSALLLLDDVSYGMVRTEVLCASCESHLGHLFPDGPPPTGLRYCINSAALRLQRFPA